MERDCTIPPEAHSPWNRRMVRNISMLPENMHNTVAMQNMTMDSASMGLRPYLSLSGPKNTCPRATPTMLVVRPSCTMEAEVSNSAPSEGVGRYMSVTKGAKADGSSRKMMVNVESLVRVADRWVGVWAVSRCPEPWPGICGGVCGRQRGGLPGREGGCRRQALLGRVRRR